MLKRIAITLVLATLLIFAGCDGGPFKGNFFEQYEPPVIIPDVSDTIDTNEDGTIVKPDEESATEEEIAEFKEKIDTLSEEMTNQYEDDPEGFVESLFTADDTDPEVLVVDEAKATAVKEVLQTKVENELEDTLNDPIYDSYKTDAAKPIIDIAEDETGETTINIDVDAITAIAADNPEVVEALVTNVVNTAVVLMDVQIKTTEAAAVVDNVSSVISAATGALASGDDTAIQELTADLGLDTIGDDPATAAISMITFLMFPEAFADGDPAALMRALSDIPEATAELMLSKRLGHTSGLVKSFANLGATAKLPNGKQKLAQKYQLFDAVVALVASVSNKVFNVMWTTPVYTVGNDPTEITNPYYVDPDMTAVEKKEQKQEAIDLMAKLLVIGIYHPAAITDGTLDGELTQAQLDDAMEAMDILLYWAENNMADVLASLDTDDGTDTNDDGITDVMESAILALINPNVWEFIKAVGLGDALGMLDSFNLGGDDTTT